MKCDEQQIAVTTGAQAALDILARILIDPGDDVWLEEPGYLGAQSAFLAAGANIMPLHVTQDGWDLSRMPARPPKVIYLTPSCQSPMGVTMRMEQRLTFLELANRWGAWVIEDDFDSEYRFTGQPIPAMQGTDRYGRTIYVGTFAKTLMPALRLGFVVLPPGFQDAFQSAINLTDNIRRWPSRQPLRISWTAASSPSICGARAASMPEGGKPSSVSAIPCWGSG